MTLAGPSLKDVSQLALKCTYVDVHNDDETTQTVAYERRLRDLRLRMFSGIRSSCSSAGGVLCFSAAPHAPRRLTLQILPAQTFSPMFACHRRQAAARRHRRGILCHEVGSSTTGARRLRR